MGSRSTFCCWEIMQCDKSENCPARKNPEKPCWEIAREIDDDYRSFFNICYDCIVHVIKAGNSVLTNLEVESIMEAKTNCKLSCKHMGQPPLTRRATTPPPG